MNNKGYATSTIIYTAVVLLSLIMFAVLKIEFIKYKHQQDFVENINTELSECLKSGDCNE